MRLLSWEGRRHRPGGAWAVFIQAGSVAAALYVLWIGALATLTGNAALWLATRLELPFLLPFAGWARAFTSQFHLDISIFIAITFPIAFLTTTAGPGAAASPGPTCVLAALSLAVALYYIVLNDRFLNWSRGFSQPTHLGHRGRADAGRPGRGALPPQHRLGTDHAARAAAAFHGVRQLHARPLRHDNFGIVYFIEMMTIKENGIFGAPLEVAATYAFLFVLFGNFYNKAGGGQLFFDLASAITGRMRGGAAKACVTASGLYGSVSGSPTADVATTGPLTIPSW